MFRILDIKRKDGTRVSGCMHLTIVFLSLQKYVNHQNLALHIAFHR